MSEHSMHYPKSYGSWAGDPEGRAPDYRRCCASVSNGERFARYYQCERSRGYGPDEAFCKQHDPVAREARRAANEARYWAKSDAKRPQWHGHEFLAALRLIAAGHNDARGLAKEIVDKFDAGSFRQKAVTGPPSSQPDNLKLSCVGGGDGRAKA